MEYPIAQGEVHAPAAQHRQLRSLGTIMATAAGRSIGTRIGARLAVQGQQIIGNLKQPKS
jgi:hypothetical protein